MQLPINNKINSDRILIRSPFTASETLLLNKIICSVSFKNYLNDIRIIKWSWRSKQSRFEFS